MSASSLLRSQPALVLPANRGLAVRPESLRRCQPGPRSHVSVLHTYRRPRAVKRALWRPRLAALLLEPSCCRRLARRTSLLMCTSLPAELHTCTLSHTLTRTHTLTHAHILPQRHAHTPRHTHSLHTHTPRHTRTHIPYPDTHTPRHTHTHSYIHTLTYTHTLAHIHTTQTHNTLISTSTYHTHIHTHPTESAVSSS